MKNPLIIKNKQHFLDLENKICVEIGVQTGVWSEQIYNCNPKELYLIDCWEQQNVEIYKNDGANVSNQEHEYNFQHVKQKFVCFSNVKIIRKLSEDACKDFSDEFFDFIYLDANHNYKICLNDLNIWFPKLKNGGWFTGHDIKGRWGKNIKSALDQFCDQNNLQWFRLNRKSWGFRK